MDLTPAELRSHSVWLLDHARDLRREAEAARRRSLSKRIKADQARERANAMRHAATDDLTERLNDGFFGRSRSGPANEAQPSASAQARSHLPARERKPRFLPAGSGRLPKLGALIAATRR